MNKNGRAGKMEATSSFQAIFETATVGMAVSDAKGRLKHVNPAFCTMLGFTETELLKKNFRDFTHPKDLERELPLLERTISEGGTQYQLEKRYIRKGGEEVWVDITVGIVRDEQDHVEGLVATVLQTTEEVAARKALRENESLLRKIAENYPNSYISIIEADYTVGFTAGREFSRQNLDPDQFVGMTLGQVFGDKADIVQEYYTKTFAGEEQTFELFINAQHQLYHTVPLTSDDGSTPRILTVVENITESVLARQQLEERTTQLGERVKELNCLVEISKLVERAGTSSLEEILQGTVDLIPSSWFYPERTAARIQFDGIQYRTNPFFEEKWNLKVPIHFHNEEHGIIEVFVKPDLTDTGESPFLKEEVVLLEAIAERLGHIAERLQATEDLNESQERLKLALEGASMGTWDRNIPTEQVIFDSGWAALLGYTLDEIQPHVDSWKNLIHPDDLEATLEKADQHFRGETEAWEAEFRMKHKSGNWVWILGKGRVNKRDSDGRPLRISGTHVDISRRKNAEEKLRQSEEKYRMLLDNAGEIIVSLDKDGKFLFVNKAAAQWLGSDQEKYVGATLSDILSKDQAETLLRNVQSVIETGEERVEEVPVRIKGDVFWFHANLQPVFNGASRAEAVLIIVSDITGRKQYEQDILAANARLNTLLELSSLQNSDISKVSDYILSTLVKMTHSPYGFFGFLNSDESVMTIHSWSGDAMKDCEIVDQPTDFVIAESGIWAEAVRLRAPLILNDYSKKHPAKRGLPGGHVPLTRLLVVPFFAGDRISTLCAVANRDTDYSDKDVEQVEGFLTSVNAIVEGKYAEEALRKSQNELKLTLENLLSGVVVHAKDTSIVYSNAEAQRILGLSDSQIKGKKAIDPRWQFVHLDGTKMELEDYPVNRALASNKPFFDYLMGVDVPEREGITWLNVNGVVVSHGEEVEEIIINFVDITEQQLSQEALQQSEDRYRLITDNMSDSIWSMDAELNFTYLSPSTERLFGYTIQEWKTLEWDKLVHPDYMGDVAKVFDKLQNDRTSDNATATVLVFHKDGHEIWVEFSATPVRDELGNTIGVVGATRDITMRKQAETALRESEEKYRTLVDNTSMGVVIAQSDPIRLSFANPAMETISGYPVDQLTSMNPEQLTNLIHPQDRKRFFANFSERIKGASIPEQNEYRLIKKDQSIVWFATHSTLISYQDSPATLTTFLDITESKHLQDQLAQAMKMESIGRLAGGVAHDFNNMLNVILGHTELALEDLPPDSPMRTDLQEVHNAGLRSADLTRQLLAFARKQTVSPKELDLNEAIASMLKMLERLIGEDINLTWKPGTKGTLIRIDPGQVDQILANLAVNARDAINHANGRLTIETANASFDKEDCIHYVDFVPGDYVILTVSDNGCGMDEETRANIFEPFFTTKDVNKGTGLGLAMVYGIVKQNNGAINVYSEPGQGTTFQIYFPALEKNTTDSTDTSHSMALERGNETILVVEDQPAILNLAKKMLERLGYSVLTAATPSEALQVAHDCKVEIDLLITDVVMPEMNGRALAEQLQEIYPHHKILYMSGYTSDIIAQQGILEKGMEFIQKPFSLQNIAKKVRSVLNS